MLWLNFFFPLINSVPCSGLDPWLLNCSFSNSTEPITIECPSSGYYSYPCVPFDDVVCEGNRTDIYRSVKCYPTEGKDPAIALCLSVVLGFLGADRFYLGYPTIGLFKMFTGGFFGLGWYIDIFLIALRISKPARGGVYKFKPAPNLIIRLPGEIWM